MSGKHDQNFSDIYLNLVMLLVKDFLNNAASSRIIFFANFS